MLPLILLLGAVLLAGCAVGPNAAERFYRGVEIGRAARPPVAPVVVGTPGTVANWIRPKNASSAQHK